MTCLCQLAVAELQVCVIKSRLKYDGSKVIVDQLIGFVCVWRPIWLALRPCTLEHNCGLTTIQGTRALQPGAPVVTDLVPNVVWYSGTDILSVLFDDEHL